MPTKQPTVLVTRPAHQADNLCQLLTHNGATPLRFPTIAIQAPKNPAVAISKLQVLEHYDFLIFISFNAVIQANELMPKPWPKDKTIVAIGPSTAKALESIGLTPSITATKPFNSEQLLAQFPANIQQNKCLIIKGEGGREMLAKHLVQQGMLVDSVDVYKRTKPAIGQPLAEAPAFITITSQLALKNLFLLLPQQANQFKQQSVFILFSRRIADYAKEQGCQHTIYCQEASDSGLVDAIKNTKNHNNC